MSGCRHVCMSPHMSGVRRGQMRTSEIPEVELKSLWTSQYRCCEQNMGPLILTTEISLQPPLNWFSIKFFLSCCKCLAPQLFHNLQSPKSLPRENTCLLCGSGIWESSKWVFFQPNFCCRSRLRSQFWGHLFKDRSGCLKGAIDFFFLTATVLVESLDNEVRVFN